MNGFWQMWAGVLDQKLCDDIVTECEYYKIFDATVGNSELNKEIRSSTVRWIEPIDQNSQFIHDLLMNYAELGNRAAFGFNISSLHQIQYTIYDGEKEDFYNWHIDTFFGNPSTYDRKISITIQLSDTDDYEGGDFEFDHQYEQPPNEDLRKRGTVLAFPSVIGHRVLPVTKGIRKSLVAWIEGPKWR